MKSILTACQPRSDILQGTFNPEIFTASLSEVIDFYRGESQAIHAIYTDAKQFFTEGTYPTDGLKMVLAEVFARIDGDGTAPAIHRLETAFGGGKTHTLIACAHIGFKGNDLDPVVKNIIDKKILPKPGEVSVVGISGELLPVHKPKGTKLIPYTLWGEIAFQIGGEDLYRTVDHDANLYAAPGKNYFDTVFKGRKVLLMIDELAQYAARLAAVRPDGGDQLAAFLMALHGYARSSSGISILLTLAGAKDAFANQTAHLVDLLSKITGKEIEADDALGIGQQAVDSIASVVARDATSVVPVQAAEISRVLAKRLFISIDESTASETASSYTEMYRKNSSLLPAEAVREDFHTRMVAHYPFHPTLIDFLNNKLSAYENFQGTRGVLRVLTLAVRSIWNQKTEIPMIHSCHLNLRDARTVAEVIGRTSSNNLLQVLNADIGGADTDNIAGGKSNAELEDLQNPHPEGWRLHEYTWKTVYLNSLVDSGKGLESNLFGLTEQDALFEISFPTMTPPQVSEALKKISTSAFYLRFEQGRYYASLEPSINIALAKIRKGLTKPDLDNLLDVTARKVVSAEVSKFNIVTDVTMPEHIPDNKGKPTLALTALMAKDINVNEFITTAGQNRPRIEQNHVLLLVPDTVKIKGVRHEQEALFKSLDSPMEESRNKLRELARAVLAMRNLKKNPQNHGINPKKLDEDDFKQRFTERENALISMVTESYRNLWFPSANGQIVCKEIRTAGGEGGVSVLEQIRKTLIEDKELLTSDSTTQSDLASLRKLFFPAPSIDVVEVQKLKENFCRLRSWPILESPLVFDQIIRAGVNRDSWCLFKMGSEETTKPVEFYSRDTGELPLNIEIGKGYSLVTPEGAKKRGWGKPKGPDKQKIKEWIRQITSQNPIATVSDTLKNLTEKYGEVENSGFKEALVDLIQAIQLMAFKGKVDQIEKPNLLYGTKAAFYSPDPADVVVTPAKASEKGWIKDEIGEGGPIKSKGILLSGKDGAHTLLPLLRRIGSLYQKGAKSKIDSMDLTDMALENGGTLRISIENIPPDSLKDLGELFEVVSGLVKLGDRTEGYLDIQHPQDGCAFVEELNKQNQKPEK